MKCVCFRFGEIWQCNCWAALRAHKRSVVMKCREIACGSSVQLYGCRHRVDLVFWEFESKQSVGFFK